MHFVMFCLCGLCLVLDPQISAPAVPKVSGSITRQTIFTLNIGSFKGNVQLRITKLSHNPNQPQQTGLNILKQRAQFCLYN